MVACTGIQGIFTFGQLWRTLCGDSFDTMNPSDIRLSFSEIGTLGYLLVKWWVLWQYVLSSTCTSNDWLLHTFTTIPGLHGKCLLILTHTGSFSTKFLVDGRLPLSSWLIYLSSYSLCTVSTLGKLVFNTWPKNNLSGDSLTSNKGTVFNTNIPNNGSAHLV